MFEALKRAHSAQVFVSVSLTHSVDALMVKAHRDGMTVMKIVPEQDVPFLANIIDTMTEMALWQKSLAQSGNQERAADHASPIPLITPDQPNRKVNEMGDDIVESFPGADPKPEPTPTPPAPEPEGE